MKKISKETWATLSDEDKALYKAEGDSYVLVDSAEPDDSKFTKERDRRRKAEKDAKEAKDKLEALEDAKNEQAGDTQAKLTKAEAKLAKAEEKFAASEQRFQNFATKTLKSDRAREIASKLSATPAVLLPHIMSRLAVDFDGDEPSLVVLDDKGEKSTMTTDQLMQNFRDNKDFAGIITATRATGGAASKAPHTAGSGVPSFAGNPGNQGQPVDLSKLDGPALAAHISAVRQQAGAEVAS